MIEAATVTPSSSRKGAGAIRARMAPAKQKPATGLLPSPVKDPTRTAIKLQTDMKHVVPFTMYAEDCVGPKAMALLDLKWQLPDQATVERTVSLTKGSISKILKNHHENSDANRSVQAILSSITQLLGAAADSQTAESLNLLIPHKFKVARNALRGLKIPDQVREEMVEALLIAKVPPPLTRGEWEDLRIQVADTVVDMLTIAAFRRDGDPDFGAGASIILWDRSARAYSFSATVSSSGRVYTELGMAFSGNQGMGAIAGRRALDSPVTVQHPTPQCNTPSGARLVELDVPAALEVPASIFMHHAQGRTTVNPVRDTFEGDSLLLVPSFRRKVFSRICCFAQDLIEARAWHCMCNADRPIADTTKVSGFLTPQMDIVVSSIEEAQCDLESKPWSLESRV